MSYKETKCNSDPEASNEAPRDPKTPTVIPYDILTVLKHDSDVLRKDLDEALEAEDDHEDWEPTAERLFTSQLESWKERAKESWSLKIQEVADTGPERCSWISKGIARAFDDKSLNDGLNATLFYFCGMHYDVENWDWGVTATLDMMKCLLAQLMDRAYDMKDFEPDLEWIRHQITIDTVNDLPNLLEAFKCLCSQLPEGFILHVLLDHIDLYWDEEPENHQYLLSVMKMFETLIKDTESKVFVKLVLTARERGAFFGRGDADYFKVDAASVYKFEDSSEREIELW